METRRLNYFIKIVESRSITAAARELGMAQPALSQQLGVLEHELRSTLFFRSRSGVTPTPAGLRLYERARRIVRDVASLERDVGDTMRSQVVTIGLVPSAMPTLGLALLRMVHKDMPSLRPQIIEAAGHALRDQLERGLLDIAVLPTSLANAQLQSRAVFRDRLYILSARGRSIDPEAPRDLAALPWIVTRAPNAVRNVLSAWFARHGLEPNVIAEVDAMPLVIDAVRADLGVTLLSSSALPSGAIREELTATDLPGELLERTFMGCWRPDTAGEHIPMIVERMALIGSAHERDGKVPS